MKQLNKEKFYKITSLSKDDIRSIYDEHTDPDSKYSKKEIQKIINNLTDSDMKTIASKLSDDYMNRLYWISLEVIFEDYYLKNKVK